MLSLGVLTLAYLACITSAEQIMFECPTGWEELNDHCYRFNIYPIYDLNLAKEDCRNDGAFLLTINSEQEHIFVKEMLDAYDSGQQKRNWWTSGRRRKAEEMDFWWEGDGTNVESFFYWINDTIPTDLTKDYIMYHFNGYIWGWILGTGAEENPFVCKISKEDIYQIRYESRGPDYGNPSPNEEDILFGPIFVQQPEDKVYEPPLNPNAVLDQAFLECLADGNPTPSYEWYRERAGERQKVDPEVSNRYTLINGKLVIDKPSLSKGDDGGYQCIAMNDFGNVISDEVQLTFGYLHDFPKSPRADVDALAYQWASIECNPPSHYPAVLHSWYKNTADNYIQPSLKPYIFISNDGRLYFSEVTQDDVGKYYCVVTKPGMNWNSGATSMPTALNILAGSPGIYEPSIGSSFPYVYPQSPKVGETVRIECWASGTSRPPLAYSWAKVVEDNGVWREVPLPNQAKKSDHDRVLTIENIQLYDGGTYRCHVERPYGRSDSKTTQVLLEAEPYFVVPLTDQFKDVGTTLTWRCEAGGVPSVVYDWYKNAEKLVILDQDQERVTVTNNVLKITDLMSRDDGMYQCVASNIHATRYSSAQLKVLSFAPSFAKYPLLHNQFATRNGNTTIICRPEAAPIAEITWWKNGAPLNPGTTEESRIRQMPNGNLFISPVSTSDQGTYSCFAENEYGKANSTGNLTVLESVTISQGPLETVVYVNKSNFLRCSASYNPLLDVTFTWYHGDLLVEFDKVFRLGENRYDFWKNPHYKRGTGILHGGLYIMNAQPEHTGQYTCEVESSVRDKFQVTTNVMIQGPPYQPAGVVVIAGSVTTTSCSIQWKKASNNGEVILAFVIETYNHWEGFWRIAFTNVRVNADSSETYHYEVTDLRPFSTYQIRVRAENKLGTSIPSEASGQFTTLPVKPDLYPDKVGGGGGKEGTLVMTWTPLDPWEENGASFGYRVFYKTAGDVDFGGKNHTIHGNINTYVLTLGKDTYYQQYDIAVQAFNTMGNGPLSPNVRIRSAMALPTAIATNVRAQPFNSTACKVTWEEVEDTREYMRGKLGGYRVGYWPLEFGPDYENPPRTTLNGQQSEGLVIGLYPDTAYYFAVYVWNEAGNGPKSSNYQQRTLRNAPINQPVEVQVFRKNDNSIHVYWRGVSTTQIEEPLEGYKVRIWRESMDIKLATDYNAGKETDLYIDDLKSDLLYKLRVFGYSRGGEGAMSSPPVVFMLGAAATNQMSLLALVLSLAIAIFQNL